MKIVKNSNSTIPHPFPYQGSKRNIARHIIAHFPGDIAYLIEPFCGSGAVSIIAAAHGLTQQFILNDLNKPLINLWQAILNHPAELVEKYEALWHEQHADKKAFFFRIREEFNTTHQPHHLLYLLARIVKGAVRYSSDGTFKQSADNRRAGMRPNTMRQQILGVSSLLTGKTKLSASDFRDVIFKAQYQDLIYMDPPYQGTSLTRDQRYYGGLSYDEFVDALKVMNRNDISYIISYDGHMGNKSYGKKLPDSLHLQHAYIHAGRSSQATLLGEQHKTVESLYLSSALVYRLANQQTAHKLIPPQQQKMNF